MRILILIVAVEEEENRRLKRMVADLSLDKQMLADFIKQSRNW